MLNSKIKDALLTKQKQKEMIKHKLYRIFRLTTLFVNGLIIFTIIFDPTIDVTSFIDYYFFYQFLYFVVCIGLTFPFFELMVTTYTLQLLGSNIWLARWKLNLLIVYNPLDNYYVTNLLYISIFAFITTLTINHSKLNEKLKLTVNRFKNYPKMGSVAINLFVVGFIFTVLNRLIPNIPTVKQLVNCLADLLYLSAICFFFSKHSFKWVYIGLILLLMLTIAFNSTLFFTAFLWMFFYFLYAQILNPWPLYIKLGAFVAVSFFLILVQAVKTEVRQKQGLNSSTSTFSKALNDKSTQIQESNASFKKKYLSVLLNRINQTFFDHLVFKNELKIENKPRPKTILTSLFAAFIPRIFWPDKPSFDNGRLYELAGLNVRGAFISISLVAEAFINFGYYGGAIFYVFFSFAVSLIVINIVKSAEKRIPLIIMFFPYLFFNLLRVEVDFTQIIYGLYSSMIFLVLLFLYFKQKGINKEILKVKV